MTIGFFFGIDLETVISGGSENVDAASFQHRSDLIFNRFIFLGVTRTLAFSGRSGCARIGAFIRTRRQGSKRKRFIKPHVVGFFFKPKRDIRKRLSFGAVQEYRLGIFA